MKCPACNEELGPPVGFDIYPMDEDSGICEQDQYVCDQCRRFISVDKIHDTKGYREVVHTGGVIAKGDSCGMEDL